MAQTVLDSRGWTVGGVRKGRWTLFGDTVLAPTEGIQTDPVTINTLPGNDNLIGILAAGTGTPEAPVSGFKVTAGTRLNLGLGDDQIIGEAPVVADSNNYGVDNEGAIDTGYGNDTIQGKSRFGVYNGYSGSINTGDGNDRIIGESSDIAPAGSDFGVVNHGVIIMGAGRDLISAANSTNGLYNDKIIQMGDGADTVDALIGGPTGTPGGFQGIQGTIDCGRGHDVVRGFGEGTFLGGAGTDTLVLQNGEYTFTPVGDTILVTTSSGNAATMTLNSFEQVCGAGLNPTYTPLTGLSGPITISIA